MVIVKVQCPDLTDVTTHDMLEFDSYTALTVVQIRSKVRPAGYAGSDL